MCGGRWVSAVHQDGAYNLVSVANGIFVVRFPLKVSASVDADSPVIGTIAAGAVRAVTTHPRTGRSHPRDAV